MYNHAMDFNGFVMVFIFLLISSQTILKELAIPGFVSRAWPYSVLRNNHEVLLCWILPPFLHLRSEGG